MACDYILFIHIPAKLGIISYTDNNLPTRMDYNGEIIQIPYLELVKQRSGASDLTFPLMNKLHVFDFDEMDSVVFNKLHKEFIDSGSMSIPTVN